MPEAKFDTQGQSPLPPVGQPAKSRSAAPLVWPSASTSGGGAYIPALPQAETDDAQDE